MSYSAPLHDIRFVLNNIVNLPQLESLGSFDELNEELTEAILTEASKFAAEILAPINEAGDTQGAVCENGVVRTSPGFAEAYGQYVEAGWGSIAFPAEYGGMGLPHTLGLTLQEMMMSANLSLMLCPLLTIGATEAILAHGTEEQKTTYATKMISGEWTGTMNLTEPHAGSDVGALRSKAEKQADGTYRIKGTKIFITYGDHDMADNVIHLVLARLPDSPPGTKGITLFIVPKYLVNEDGSLGPRNDVQTVSVEHKLGIHGSPTCTLSFGDNEGAVGYLLGAENKGMSCMFTMMNAARLAVGLQGPALIEGAYQKALAFALERRQGKPFGKQHEQADMVPIIDHPDVRRMLLTMKAYSEATRAICYANSMAIDLALHHPDEEVREKAKLREELLTPISKGFSTEMGIECTSLGVQVHGGMGYVEETGAAQFLRDVRISTIYEGTTGIQAMDLAVRKLALAGGEAVKDLIGEVAQTVSQLESSGDADLVIIAQALGSANDELAKTATWLGGKLMSDPLETLAGATPYLMAFGHVAGGHYLGLGALAAKGHLDAGQGDSAFYQAKIGIAKFYAQNLLPKAHAHARAAVSGSDSLMRLTPEQMAGWDQ